MRVEERLCGGCLELADVIWAPPVVGGCLRDMIEGLEYLLRMGNEFVGPGSQHAIW